MAVVLALSAACGGGGDGPPPPAPVQNAQVDVGGQTRSYRVFVPPTLDRRHPVPLVLALHGGNNTVDDMVKTSGFDKEASAGEFVVAYPEGIARAWNAGRCCGLAPRRGTDDVGFLVAVLDQVEASYPIDRARVFVTGVSNGAMMAYRLACEHADRVTAVGVVAGAVTVDECAPSRPVSVLEIHGTEDTLIPYLGGIPEAPEAQAGGAYPPTPAMIRRWAEIDRCPPAAPATVGGPVTTESWTGCANGTSVSLVSVQGGGHVWFAPGLGPADGAVDATETIWRFFDGLRP